MIQPEVLTMTNLKPPGWSIVGASVTGSGHLDRSQPGQDRMGWRVWQGVGLESPLCVIVCADGAGSAQRSWAGAWMACRALISAIDAAMQSPAGRARMRDSRGWSTGFVERLFSQARRRVLGFSSAIHAAPADLSTTLNMAVLGPDFGCFAQVGDGLIAFQAGSEYPDWTLASVPDMGEFAGETTFLTSQNFSEKLAVRLVPQAIDKICLSTDGLAPIIYNSQQSAIHSPFLNPLWQGLARPGLMESQKTLALAQFLKSPRVASRCDDDLTLILAERMTAVENE